MMLAPIHKTEFKLNQLSPVFKDFPFLTQERYSCPADLADVEFIFRELSKVPDPIKRLILNNAVKLKIRRERNLYILKTVKRIVGLLPETLSDAMTVDNDAIRDIAIECADRCRRIAMHHNVKSQKLSKSTNYPEGFGNNENGVNPNMETFDANSIQNSKNEFKFQNGISAKAKPFSDVQNNQNRVSADFENQLPNLPPILESIRNSRNVTKRNDPLTEIGGPNSTHIFETLSKLCGTFRINPPKISKKGVTEIGAIKRMCDKNWWNRRLRKLFNQAYEQAAIELNQVHKYKQIYASDLTVYKRKQQKARNEAMLSSMKVINDIGQQFSLKELSDLNVSNPSARKAELMVRMRGFEELSKAHGHQGIFITITCPSKYHAVYAKSGQPNPKYQGYTPYMANQYLCSVWSRIRAHWERQGIKPYGFRVAEPQHDGTPHWHLLLFTEKHHLNAVKETIKHYALAEDGEEKGAAENRCDFKIIDPTKGSATGYIAKYVSKNIDGEGLDVGVYGEDPITAAQRVDAWASCWCIRQFQQIGGASVSVWRELRRLKQQMGIDTLIERARIAADKSKWHDYINVMGGVFATRKHRPINLAYDVSFDSTTGECKLGFYDGNIIQTIKGLMYKGQRIVTRFFNWRIERTNAVCSYLEFCK